MKSKIFFWILKVFIFWRISLFIFAWIGTRILPFKYSFPYIEELLKPCGDPILWSWANFDGVHYLGIAAKSYFAQYTQAFFPFYPILIHYFNYIFNNYLLSGLIISNFSFFGALYFLYKLLSLDFSQKLVERIILFLIFFPTSFFFASFYTESLFLLFLFSSFYAIRKKNWFLAGFLGLLLAATKVIGVLIIPAFLWEWYQNIKKQNKTHSIQFKNLFFIFLPLLGIGSYMFYLQKNFSDPLYFLHAQPFFGASRDTDKIILFYQVIFRYVKMLLTFRGDKLFYFTINLELFSALLFLVLLFIAIRQKQRMSYLAFALLAYILPTLTGTFSSMPRYVLVLFPCFIVLGLIKKNIIRRFLLFTFYFLLCFCTILFTRGYWIA